MFNFEDWLARAMAREKKPSIIGVFGNAWKDLEAKYGPAEGGILRIPSGDAIVLVTQMEDVLLCPSGVLDDK